MSELPKIAFVSQSRSWGGLEMNMVRYASWMQERGWNTVVFCLENSSVQQRALSLGLKIHAYELPFSSPFKLAGKVSKMLREEKAEVLWFREKEFQKTLPLIKSRQRIFTLYQQGMQLGKAKKDLLHRLLYRSIDCWLSPNKFMYEQVLDWTSMPEDRVHLIPLGMELAPFLSRKLDKQEARKVLKLSDEGYIMGVIGRIDPLKNQLFALRAFSELASKEPSLELVIMGDCTFGEAGSYLAEIKQFIEDKQLKDRVHLLPYRPEVELFYSAVDLMIMPSINESFGRVSLEAMTMGLPIVGSDSGGTGELLGQGKYGKVYRNEDLSSLIHELQHALSSPEEMQKLGQLAAEEARNHYSHEVVLDRCEAIILKGLGKKITE